MKKVLALSLCWLVGAVAAVADPPEPVTDPPFPVTQPVLPKPGAPAAQSGDSATLAGMLQDRRGN